MTEVIVPENKLTLHKCTFIYPCRLGRLGNQIIFINCVTNTKLVECSKHTWLRYETCLSMKDSFLFSHLGCYESTAVSLVILHGHLGIFITRLGCHIF